jgi:hypothetical protein
MLANPTNLQSIHFFPPSYDKQQKLFEESYNVNSQEFSNWNNKKRQVKQQVKTHGKQEVGRNAIQVAQCSL